MESFLTADILSIFLGFDHDHDRTVQYLYHNRVWSCDLFVSVSSNEVSVSHRLPEERPSVEEAPARTSFLD